MKHLIIAALALTLPLTGYTTDLEVAMYYPSSYENNKNVNVASEVVGFYSSLESANEFLANNQVNLTLKPTHISLLDHGYFDDDTDIWDGLNDMEKVTFNKGHVSIGVFKQIGNYYGFADVKESSQYSANDSSIQHAVVVSGRTLNPNLPNPYLLLHELVHTLGAKHEASQVASFNDDGLGLTNGYGGRCNNSTVSLMHENTAFGRQNSMSLTGTSACDNDPSANMVEFIHHYAPIVSKFNPHANNQTLKLMVNENTNTQEFEFTVERSTTGRHENARLYISAGNHTSSDVIAPINLAFDLDSRVSHLVSVPFSQIHPLFNSSKTGKYSTYAVAVGDNEVQPLLTDLLKSNTAWTDPDIAKPTPEPIPKPNPDTSSSSGGSLTWLLLLALVSLGRRREM